MINFDLYLTSRFFSAVAQCYLVSAHLPVEAITDLSNDSLTQLLLYGDQDLTDDLNRNILELTLRFIQETGRFD